jgi:hypothetical protein
MRIALLFCQPQVRWKLCEVGSSLGAQPIPQQVEQLRKVAAIGAPTTLDEANLRDSIFVLRRNPPDIGSLNHSALKFTSQETVAYFEFISNFRQILTAASNAATTGLLSAPAIQSTRLVQLIPEALGPDCAISASWAPQQLRPTGLIAIQIRDRAKAEDTLRELLALFPEASVTELEGIRCFSFPWMQSAFANPTLLSLGLLVLASIPAIEPFLTILRGTPKPICALRLPPTEPQMKLRLRGQHFERGFRVRQVTF